MNKDIVELIMSLKEDISGIATDVARLNDKLDAHSAKSKETAEKVALLEKDAWRLKGAIATLLSLSALVGIYKTLF